MRCNHAVGLLAAVFLVPAWLMPRLLASRGIVLGGAVLGNTELIDAPTQVLRLPLSDDEKERILYANARAFFDLQ